MSTSPLPRVKRLRFWARPVPENHACYILRGFGKAGFGRHSVNGRVLPTDDDGVRTRGRLQHIGFVYQFHNLLPEFSALENVMLPLRLRGQAVTQPAAAGIFWQSSV